MKIWIWIGIGLATVVLGYTVWAMFIKKDIDAAKGGGWGFSPRTKTGYKAYM